MTVAELIKELQKVPSHVPVFTRQEHEPILVEEVTLYDGADRPEDIHIVLKGKTGISDYKFTKQIGLFK